MIQLWSSNGFIKKFLDWIKVYKLPGLENLCKYLQIVRKTLFWNPDLNMKRVYWKEFVNGIGYPPTFHTDKVIGYANLASPELVD